MSVFPVNRVPDILKRMDLNSSQAEAMKTCFGILAIMSREDSNKILIAKDGMDIILNAMTTHVDRTDVQESGCDLLWSLAFNSTAVKDIIAKHGGATVLVRALKRHSRSADFLKSACGALSNMCQSKLNQEGVSSQGGLQPLVGSIHVHQTSAKLLPFIFDAIASIIVNNEDNARTVSSLGIIPVVVASLSRHKPCMEVVKSGCHTLAILSDVKGQASKIAFAGGVPIILSLLDAHPLYSDLHRVAAVVLLRMLQESAHVGREITCHEGVRILLTSLEKGGAQQDTVAAVTHILYTVTNPSSPASSAIESQLWLQGKSMAVSGTAVALAEEDGAAGSRSSALTVRESPTMAGKKSPSPVPTAQQHSALGGIVLILGQYSSRRDVVRAACRLVNNLSGFPNVIQALDRLQLLDKMLECVSLHKDTKDVVDSAVSLIKAIHRKSLPLLSASSAGTVHGLLHLFRAKALLDEDFAVACIELLVRLAEVTARLGADRRRELEEARLLEGKLWESHALSVCVSLLEAVVDADRDCDVVTLASSSGNSLARSLNFSKTGWAKGTIRCIGGILAFVEAVFLNSRASAEPVMTKSTFEVLCSILRVMPAKHAETVKRLEKVLALFDTHSGPTRKSDKFVVSKKSPQGSGGLDGFFPISAASGAPRGTAKQSEDDHSSFAAKATGSTAAGDVGERASSSPAAATSGLMAQSRHGSSSSLSQQNDAKSSGQSWASTGTVSDQSGSRRLLEFNSEEGGRLLPKHPLKHALDSTGRPKDAKLDKDVRLLNCWPNYLERLNLTSNPAALSRSFMNQSSTEVSAASRMHVCYESGTAAGKGLLSKCLTPVPYLVPPNGQGEPFAHSLSFDSEFESGNLLRAVQKADAVYDLFLRSDLHTQGHTQWFYFAVANTHPPDLVRLHDQKVQVPPVRVRFNIVNLTKPDSLFNLGMRPVVYSCHDATTKGAGWMRSGTDISYYSNSFMRNNTAGEGLACYYTLSFTLEFTNPRDTALVAYSYPFTMSDYRHHIRQILDRPRSSDIIRQTRLCQTLGGDDCDLLVITNFRDKDKDRIGPISVGAVESRFEDGSVPSSLGRSSNAKSSSKDAKAGAQSRLTLKPSLFVSARVHPGETPASWMMKGMLDFLTSDCSQAKLLRQVFVIFIVPVLNPDGVTYGNNRCSLAGVDLNRQWKLPAKSLHPTIYFLKSFMAAQRKIREVHMYIDLHGHSRKYNVFMYGCDDKKRPKPQVRAFPKFFSMHNIGKKYVCFADCSFHVKKGRESTARVVVAKDLNIPCSFTLEATFCGSNYGPLKHCHMNIGHMQEVGAALCDAILNFAISEGQVKDTLMVPANLKAVAQVERAIADEGQAEASSFFASVESAADYSDGHLMEMDSAGPSPMSSQQTVHRARADRQPVDDQAAADYGVERAGGDDSEEAAREEEDRDDLSSGSDNESAEVVSESDSVACSVRALQLEADTADSTLQSQKVQPVARAGSSGSVLGSRSCKTSRSSIATAGPVLSSVSVGSSLSGIAMMPEASRAAELFASATLSDARVSGLVLRKSDQLSIFSGPLSDRAHGRKLDQGFASQQFDEALFESATDSAVSRADRHDELMGKIKRSSVSKKKKNGTAQPLQTSSVGRTSSFSANTAKLLLDNTPLSQFDGSRKSSFSEPRAVGSADFEVAESPRGEGSNLSALGSRGLSSTAK